MNEKALKVIEAAKSQLGNPYVFGMWGGNARPPCAAGTRAITPAISAPSLRRAPC